MRKKFVPKNCRDWSSKNQKWGLTTQSQDDGGKKGKESKDKQAGKKGVVPFWPAAWGRSFR